MADELANLPATTENHYPQSHDRFPIPQLIVGQGPAAEFAWDEFFAGQLRNLHTRAAYRHAVEKFLVWVDVQGVELPRVSPGMVGTYLDQLPVSVPTKKLALAALRRFFDVLVNRHVMILNPALTVRGDRHQVIEGKTPEITVKQARQLLDSIPTDTVANLRDRAIIGTLIFTAARVGAVAKLRVKDLTNDGSQYLLRFNEKGGKLREIPVHHELQAMLLAYLNSAGQSSEANQPVFVTLAGRRGHLTQRGMSGVDMCRMLKRRLHAAGLSDRISPHSFRVLAVTSLLLDGVPLEEVQFLAGHADPRTTRLYDRRQRRVTRNVVERITV